MSLTITPQISGQQANSTLSYSFLMEPLKIHITDSDSTVSEIFVDVTRIGTDTGTAEVTKIKYVQKDINSLGGVILDLSKVMLQLNDFDVYKIQSVSDITSGTGWNSVVSKYIYKFEVYTNQSETKTEILKLPIIGARSFSEFVPAVDYNTTIQELTSAQLSNTNLSGYSIPSFSLKQISTVSDSDYSPTRSTLAVTTGSAPCEGVIHWKSKLGGWMSWGMDLSTTTKGHSYTGKINTGMFKSTSFSGGGNPYVEANYTGSTSTFSISLKHLSLSVEELIAVSEINGTPAIYYQPSASSALELMKLKSASAPIKSLIQGGDFSVSLQRISNTSNRVK